MEHRNFTLPRGISDASDNKELGNFVFVKTECIEEIELWQEDHQNVGEFACDAEKHPTVKENHSTLIENHPTVKEEVSREQKEESFAIDTHSKKEDHKYITNEENDINIIEQNLIKEEYPIDIKNEYPVGLKQEPITENKWANIQTYSHSNRCRKTKDGSVTNEDLSTKDSNHSFKEVNSSGSNEDLINDPNQVQLTSPNKSFAVFGPCDFCTRFSLNCDHSPDGLCVICGKYYPKKSALLYHYITKHKKNNRCPHCPFKFETLKQIKKHTAHFHGPNTFCRICGVDYEEEVFLEHMECHTKRSWEFTCEKCDKQMPDQRSYDRHLLDHVKTRPHPCNRCNKIFISQDELTLHFCEHVGQRLPSQKAPVTPPMKEKFICKMCDTSFDVEENLIRHSQYHEDHRKIHKCETCGKEISGKIKYNWHVRKHRTKKSFSCDLCDKSFVSKVDLVLHTTSHMGHLFACNFCCKLFASDQLRAAHILECHPPKLVKCKICKLQFGAEQLFHHMRYHENQSKKSKADETMTGQNEGKFTCRFCNEDFTTNFALKVHLGFCKSFKVDCRCCGLPFRKQSQYFRHLKDKKKEQKPTCTNCGKVFQYLSKLKKHRDVCRMARLNFKCEVCEMVFHGKEVLVEHKLIHETSGEGDK